MNDDKEPLKVKVTQLLVIEIPKDLHRIIKTQALFRNITIRKYIIQAVIERMKRDEKYQ